MLNIRFNNGAIIVDNIEGLTGIQCGGLELSGFVRSNNTEYVLKTQNLDSELSDLIDYLKYENLRFCLDEYLTTIQDNSNYLQQQFEELKVEALNFKNGNFEAEEYRVFQKGISNLISRPLKNHQEKAAYHLYKIKNGANFSVPGSGKTSVVLSVYEKLRSEGLVNTLFVVGPLASFGPWKNEFEIVLGRKANLKVLAGGSQSERRLNYYDSKETKAEIYLTSFQTLLFDSEQVSHLFKNEGIDIFFVIDEAHYIKRIDGQWAQAVLGLSSLSKIRCILTGTPIPKSYTDIFNLIDFLWPNSMAIDEASRIRIKSLENANDIHRAAELVKEKINPLFYRVRKKELGLREQIFLEPEKVKMRHFEKLIYKAIENRIEDYSKKDYAANIKYVSKLYKGRMIRLRQAVSNVALMSNPLENYNEDLLYDRSDLKKIIENYHQLETPGKIFALLDLVKQIRTKGRKVVIWSNFIGTLELIKSHLSQNGFNSEIIFGGTPIEKEYQSLENSREKIRNRFVDSNSGLDILIANPAACAESISLHTTCKDAIYYDLSYNCAQYLQTLDRIHRVGGSEKEPSYYHFLQYEDSIDVDIISNLNLKAEKMFEIIEEDFTIYSLDMYDDGESDFDAYTRLYK
ncbi:SNF2-related protein [Sungkyunkwania multivorans]|uniref:SNF2-related protein n=1 Tax=Sungkyunkwania multivorans TaxID=1173618 RepID=A0ABW3CXQ1_9FLAO